MLRDYFCFRTMKSLIAEILASVRSCEICPSAALSRRWFAQRTQIRFRYHFRDALQVTKFVGE